MSNHSEAKQYLQDLKRYWSKHQFQQLEALAKSEGMTVLEYIAAVMDA